MTDQLKQAAMQQALNLIERLNAHGWILADFEEEVYASIAALKAALKRQPVQEPVMLNGLTEAETNATASVMGLKKHMQPVQEPVAWAVQACSKMWRGEYAEIDAKAEAKRCGGTCVAYPLYTTPPPPQRPWQGLTDEEMSEIVADMDVDFGDLLWKVVCLTKIIEATLKERNCE
jgi:hypothetical protein